MTFQEFVYNCELGHHEIIFDGQIHRIKPPGSKAKSAWYVAHRNLEFEAGTVGDWRSGFKQNFYNFNTTKLTSSQKRKYAINRAKVARLFKEEEYKRHLSAKDEINGIWGKASTEDVDSHPYLAKKQISVSGIRKNTDGDIVIPIYDSNRILWNLQIIKSNGRKLFHKGGKINDCYHPMGFLNNVHPQLIICEGYSTGVSIYQATKIATAVCFSANNLENVAKSLRAKYPNTNIIVAGDDDQFNSVNIGRNKSFIAAKQVNASTIFPVFEDLSTKPTDFNDLHCLEGLETVRKQFMGVCDVF